MPHARSVPRALLAVLVTGLLILAPALAPALSGPWAASSQAAPLPADPEDPIEEGPVALDLVSLTPTSLGNDDELTATVEVTNTSGQALADPLLELRTRTPRVTDRSMLMEWHGRSGPDLVGAPVAVSKSTEALAPGQTRRFTVTASAEDLGYSSEPYFWGTRRLSLTLATQDGPQDALWTSTVWHPDGADVQMGVSVLLPVMAPAPSQLVTDPEGSARSMEDGDLAALRTMAEHPGVDWWLDPSLLDPPLRPPSPEETGVEPGPLPATPMEPDPAAQEYAEALQGAADERTILTSPYARADLNAMQDAGAGLLSEAITDAGTRTLDDRDVTAAASIGVLPATQVTPDAVRALRSIDADALVIPSSSLRLDPLSTVTPSSSGVIVDGEDRIPVLAPDPELSATFLTVSSGRDPELAIAELLAQTATIASDQVSGPRHVLIAPSPQADLDAEAMTTAVEELQSAPWLVQRPTEDLLAAAREGTMTTSTTDTNGDLYALGEIPIDQVRASGPDDVGRFVHRATPSPATPLDATALQSLQNAWVRTDSLSTVLEDPSGLAGMRRELLTGTSVQWRGDSSEPRALAASVQKDLDAVHQAIRVEPASSYNVISDNPQVPVTLVNDLDTAVTVQPVVAVERPLVKVTQVEPVTIPAHGQVDVQVPMEAIASGTIDMTMHLEAPDGSSVGVPGTSSLSVNPAWESWTTLVLVVAMSILVVVGVARARRTGSDTRAPAQLGPEDPAELSRTGRSWPAAASPSSPDSAPSPSAPDSAETDPEPPAPERPRSTE